MSTIQSKQTEAKIQVQLLKCKLQCNLKLDTENSITVTVVTYLGTHVTGQRNHCKVVHYNKAPNVQWLAVRHDTWSDVDED